MGILDRFKKKIIPEDNDCHEVEMTEVKEKPINYHWDEDETSIRLRLYNQSIIETLRIPKNNLLSLDNKEVVYKEFYNSHYINWKNSKEIENKSKQYKIYSTEYVRAAIFNEVHYSSGCQCNDVWVIYENKFVEKHLIEELSIQEYFKRYYDSKYKLIETEDELNEYLESKLSCDDWCRLKLVKKMKEIELGDGFINGFADLIGNDLDKYHQMIDLANECSDKDILMYLFTFKFGKKEDESKYKVNVGNGMCFDTRDVKKYIDD